MILKRPMMAMVREAGHRPQAQVDLKYPYWTGLNGIGEGCKSEALLCTFPARLKQSRSPRD
jgi:hypothetical protein